MTKEELIVARTYLNDIVENKNYTVYKHTTPSNKIYFFNFW